MEHSSPATSAGQIKHLSGSLASLAATLGLGAVTAAAACCVLPLALASVGIGAGLAAGFTVLASIRTPLLIASGAVLIVAWLIWWRRPKRACGPDQACAVPDRRRGLLALLIASTVLIVLAGLWSSLEPMLMKWVS